MTGMWLGDLGAEVIKIEAMQRYDHSRGPIRAPEGLPGYPDRVPGERPYDLAPAYVQANRNKQSIVLDLSSGVGVTVFKELVAVTDIVVTNMVTGVPEKMGVGYDDLRRVRPDLIMLLSSGYGMTGPYAYRVTMGGAMDGIAGYMHLRHYPDSAPDTNTFSTETDVVTSLNNSMAVLMAIYHRLETGRGGVVETAGVEASIHQIGPALMDYALNGRVQSSIGNGHRTMAPHGCYPCAGDDQWIAVTVESELQWQALCDVMERPPWTRDARFSNSLARWRAREELDALLSEWTRTQEHNTLMHGLQAAGVPAAAVHDARDHAEDPHWKSRGVYELAQVGDRGEYLLPTAPWVFEGRRAGIWRPPPPFGRDNAQVLEGLLGMQEEEVRHLRDSQVVGDAPLQHDV